ncbi:MAG: hypothetical protein JWO43_553 [Candidatus Adlerbacteria bacterium]|nr:hypothetical protein [Candidatus Adlerbacteria bacterium]
MVKHQDTYTQLVDLYLEGAPLAAVYSGRAGKRAVNNAQDPPQGHEHDQRHQVPHDSCFVSGDLDLGGTHH